MYEDYEYYHTDPVDTDIIETVQIPTYSEIEEAVRVLKRYTNAPENEVKIVARTWSAIAHYLRYLESK